MPSCGGGSSLTLFDFLSPVVLAAANVALAFLAGAAVVTSRQTLDRFFFVFFFLVPGASLTDARGFASWRDDGSSWGRFVPAEALFALAAVVAVATWRRLSEADEAFRWTSDSLSLADGSVSTAAAAVGRFLGTSKSSRDVCLPLLRVRLLTD